MLENGGHDMRFIAGLFILGALAVAGIVGAWAMHTYRVCSAASAVTGCADVRGTFSVALLVFLAAMAGFGAILVTRQNH